MGEKKHKRRDLLCVERDEYKRKLNAALAEIERRGQRIDMLTFNLDKLWSALGEPEGGGKDRIKPMLDRIAELTKAADEGAAAKAEVTRLESAMIVAQQRLDYETARVRAEVGTIGQ